MAEFVKGVNGGSGASAFTANSLDSTHVQEIVADNFIAACGVTRHGSFEGKNILESVGDMCQRLASELEALTAARSSPRGTA